MVVLSGIGFLGSACPGSVPMGADRAVQAGAPDLAMESIYDGGWRAEWQASGLAQQEFVAGGAVKVRFTGSADWTLTRREPLGPCDALVFNVKEPFGEGEFLEVHIGSGDGGISPGVKVKPDHRMELADGWFLVRIPLSELGISGASFDRVVFRSFRPLEGEWVLFDKMALLRSSPGRPAPGQAIAAGSATAAPPTIAPEALGRIACDATAIPISPLIYGIAGGDDKSRWRELGATARRWGGNPTSRYNWETHFSNGANDWFFENRAGGGGYVAFVSEGIAHGVLSALTIPMMGWAAKDGSSYSFPVSVFGPQTKTDPWHPDAGNGVALDGKSITPGSPTATSVPAPPEWARRWVSTVASAQRTGKRAVCQYILDNEPMLWHVTHRDLHPDPLGYDELLDRSIRYGTAIREADPDAVVAGPAEWGWPAYFDSAKDLSAGGGNADRRAHGDVPLVEWYLRKMREHEEKAHVRILDVLDLHYYPQETNVYGGGAGGVDRATQLLRLRSTRSLWDPSYVDESWIHDAVRLLPRMKEWVAGNYPGRGLSIGEWNFGGERDITGALATAEALGRFAQFGVTSAFYWAVPPDGSPSAFGFLAYRDFDGRGGHFLDWFVPATSADGISLFASRDADRAHMVVVAINMSPDTSRMAQLDLHTCGTIASQQAFTYVQGATSLAQSAPTKGEGSSLVQLLPPWSIVVIDVRMSGARSALPR